MLRLLRLLKEQIAFCFHGYESVNMHMLLLVRFLYSGCTLYIFHSFFYLHYQILVQKIRFPIFTTPDTSVYFQSINVMDYSLLLGVDTERRELVCGIIDYLRQYTWDKQLETWVKSSLVVPKNVLPTVISPKEYKKRFRKFMSTHFLSVPDDWCLQGSSEPHEDYHLSQYKSQKQGGINGFSS